MTDRTERNRGRHGVIRNRGGRPGWLLLPLLMGALLSGCRNQDAPPEDLKPITVGPVEMHGMQLDVDATPQQVTYALMQALRETAEAGRNRAQDKEKLKALLENLLRVAAPRRIYRGFPPGGDPDAVPQKHRDEVVYRVVRYWAPIAARYVGSFERDPARAMTAMRLKQFGESDARVSYDVTDPEDGSKMTFQVYLTPEPDATKTRKYWRAYRLGYAPFGRDDPPTETRPATRPTTKAAGK